MMNHTGSIALGLGLFFAVPAITLGGGLPDSIENALDETLYALKVLSQINEQIENGEELSAQTVIDVTEPPMEDERASDERLTGLRDEVAVLQAKLDRRKLSEEPPVIQPSDTKEAPIHAPHNRPGSMSTTGISRGLSQTFIQALKSKEIGPQTPESQGHADHQTSSSQPTSKPTHDDDLRGEQDSRPEKSPEAEGYSANPLRQAQACLRSGRYEQGVLLLKSAKPSPTVDYWMARLLERLGRIDEAIELYTSIETNDAAVELHVASKRDREFAQWRLEFMKKSGLKKNRGDA